MKAPSTPVPIAFDPGAAHVYDPYGDGRDNPTDARYAIDGDARTSWRTRDYPGGALAKPGVGLYVDAAVATTFRTLTIQTSTPGYDVEIYGATKGPPSTVPGSGWTQIATRSSIKSTSRFSFGSGQRYRYVLIWITRLPPGSAHAAINELTLIS